MITTGMLWDGTTSVHNNWGSEPALVRPLSLELRMKTFYSHMGITPPDRFGNPLEDATDTIAADSMGYVSVALNTGTDGTLWDGIDAFDYTEPQDTVTSIRQPVVERSLHCYPNPAVEEVVFELDHPGRVEDRGGLFTGRFLVVK